MIGHSNVGKTSYTSSMYHAMQAGEQGFTLRTTRPDQHQRLISQAVEMLRGRFPPASDRAAVYEMTLQHRGREIMPVVWRDHRGGALYERTSSQQATDLLADIHQADGFLLFGDARQLLEDSGRVNRSIQNAVTHLLRVLPERRGRTTPLVIVITKIDLVSAVDRDMRRLTEPFRPLLDAVTDAPDLHVTTAPVVCGSLPEGLLRPVHWAVCFGLIQRGRELVEQVGARLAEAAAAADRDTTWNRWHSKLDTSIPSQRAIARELQARALHEWSSVMPLLGHVVQLLGNQAPRQLTFPTFQ